jgi:hypothetical protein
MQIYSSATNYFRYIAFVFIGLSFSINSIAQTDPPKPPSPNTNIPNISKEHTTVICVDCDQPFEFDGHEQANEAILDNPYVDELRKAMYWQDIFHQFESKAHYDNCDFDGATTYIDELLQEVGAYSSDAQRAYDMSDKATTEKFVRKAFFALGQALHATQDFYAHSNYVELKTKNVRGVNEISLIRPWTDDGKRRITNLRKEGLISGFVFWGFPQECAKDTLSHKLLAKDTNDSKSGKVRLPSLENMTQYKVALYLARETSKDLVIYALRTWSILKTINGSNVAFDTLIESRGI